MKIERAIIIFDDNDEVEYPEMKATDLAHELIKLAEPKLEIVIPESQIEKFRSEAKKDYMHTTKLFTDFEAYQELYVRLKVNEYVRLEHAKHSYNEMVLAYEAKIKSLKQ